MQLVFASAADLADDCLHPLLKRRIIIRCCVVEAVVEASAKYQAKPAVGFVSLLHHQGYHIDTAQAHLESAFAQASRLLRNQEQRQEEQAEAAESASPLLVGVV